MKYFIMMSVLVLSQSLWADCRLEVDATTTENLNISISDSTVANILRSKNYKVRVLTNPGINDFESEANMRLTTEAWSQALLFKMTPEDNATNRGAVATITDLSGQTLSQGKYHKIKEGRFARVSFNNPIRKALKKLASCSEL